MVFALVQTVEGVVWNGIVPAFAFIIAAGLVMECVGLYYHMRDLVANGGEGSASHYEQTTKFGKTYLVRNAGLITGLIFMIILGSLGAGGTADLIVWLVAAAIIVVTAMIGRALFYA